MGGGSVLVVNVGLNTKEPNLALESSQTSWSTISDAKQGNLLLKLSLHHTKVGIFTYFSLTKVS